MPKSRELANKKSESKDRQSRGPPGSSDTKCKKAGAGAHNWGKPEDAGEDLTAFDKNDPNYVDPNEDQAGTAVGAQQ